MILSETLIDMKIADMLKQQKALLDEGLDINKDGDVVKVKKEWDASVLNSGGITYRKVNNKWYRVSVVGDNNDIILKFKIKSALGKTINTIINPCLDFLFYQRSQGLPYAAKRFIRRHIQILLQFVQCFPHYVSTPLG